MIPETLFAISAISTLIGAIGALRFPDFYTRTHALTMVSVGGAILGILSLALPEGFNVYSVKAIMVVAFIMVTSPAGAHAIAQAAHSSGQKPHATKDALAESREKQPVSEAKQEPSKGVLHVARPDKAA